MMPTIVEEASGSEPSAMVYGIGWYDIEHERRSGNEQ